MIYNGKPIPFIMNRMDIQGRILQSLRPRRDGILLRSDLKALGSDSQISAALVELRRKGAIQRIERGVYAQPTKLAALGKSALLERAHWRQA
jgi:predicted transcriptional regulator of viral defense system